MNDRVSNGAMPAYPMPITEGCADIKGDLYFPGLTKRELFAAMAMQGALGGQPGSHLVPATLAAESVQHADLLLDELAKDPK